MAAFPKHPIIYEINTWVWLKELARRYGRPMTLADLPAAEWDALANLGVDAVWLMGVWERSPAGIAVAMLNDALQADFRRALPDFVSGDIVGSPYCVRRYEVDPAFGGRDGVAAARRMLAERSIRLFLDFVPNHVAPDHPWVGSHPEYFIPGSEEELQGDPNAFYKRNDKVLACGKDPFFPAWPDVVQLNAFQPGLRQAVIQTLADIAAQCDGVRCDMAMLMMSKVFSQTWAGRAGAAPEIDYWPEVIAGVRQQHPDFLFLAEAYWDLEWELQQQGFDYCYDKRLYDRLKGGSSESVRLHLLADISFQEKLVRFLENHDEPRAATIFPPAKLRAAAVTVSTLPGALLVHEGQLEGRAARVPVFLARRPEEETNRELRGFYLQLLAALKERKIRSGEWRLCDCHGWPDNGSFRNLIAWCWQAGEKLFLIVVNHSTVRSQAQVHLSWAALAGRLWQLDDLFSRAEYHHDGNELQREGLFVDLEPWGYHLLAVRPMVF